MKIKIWPYLWQAACGRGRIKRLLRQNKINIVEDFVIFFPDNDEKVKEATLNGLNYLAEQCREYRSKFNIKTDSRFFLISSIGGMLEDSDVIFSVPHEVIYIAQREMEDILRFYAFREYGPERLIIASIDRPNGRQCRGVVKAGKISLEEIIAVSVLGVEHRNYEKWSIPVIQK